MLPVPLNSSKITSSILEPVSISAVAVSYTHLDVYKRQVGNSFGITKTNLNFLAGSPAGDGTQTFF